MDNEKLCRLQELLGYHFEDERLLVKAFTHSSLVDDYFESNERLEFLGDSVLALVICRKLFMKFPGYREGDLTKIKSMLVSRKTCARIANELALAEFIMVGKGMGKTQALFGSISAGVMEAIIGAMYIDGGFGCAEDFILRAFGSIIETTDSKHHHENFKSILQQYCQQKFATTPTYEMLDEKGPDHNKCFEVVVTIDHRRFQSAWGGTKKDAEQQAAYKALVELEQIGPLDKDDMQAKA